MRRLLRKIATCETENLGDLSTRQILCSGRIDSGARAFMSRSRDRVPCCRFRERYRLRYLILLLCLSTASHAVAITPAETTIRHYIAHAQPAQLALDGKKLVNINSGTANVNGVRTAVVLCKHNCSNGVLRHIGSQNLLTCSAHLR